MPEYDFPDVTDRLEIHPSAYISPHAHVCGTVQIGADSSIWPMCVIRGDEGVIRLGARCNVQDGTIMHADPSAYLWIGDNVSIGHAAIVHGCTIEDEVLIGMGAVVLNRAHIGRGSLIAARALITEDMIVPPGSLVMGIPGVIRPLRPEHHERIRHTAQAYVDLKTLYQAQQTRQTTEA